KDYRGYRLLAIDGSDLQIAANPADTNTYFQNQPGTKGYNLLHLNAAYDLCNRLYVDAIVQPRRQWNEGRALATMVDRSPLQGKTIVIADRG
ncbi:transposase, partial [Paenibacillus sp. CGMCC 1.18879]|uniref:transposase n=1 Tax=Paenibacillus sp. CGMCC 1.18879 TaxID=2834466 RepID=UPI001CA7CF35